MNDEFQDSTVSDFNTWDEPSDSDGHKGYNVGGRGDNHTNSQSYEGCETGLAENPDKHPRKRVDGAVTDANKRLQNDGRSTTRTGFKPWEAPEDEQAKFEEWNQINDGKYAPDRKEQNRRVNRERDAETFMSYLECSEYQQERVMELLEAHDGGSMGGTTTDEELILTLIAIAVDEDDMAEKNMGEFCDTDKWDELRFAVGMKQGKVTQVRNLLERRNLMSETQDGGALQVG